MSENSQPITQGDPAQESPYRQALQMTDEMRQHCHIYFDEQLYTSALTLLSDLVTSGVSHPEALSRATFAPAPFHIELISALLIHPRHTNQARPNERLELASRSITFLRNTLSILGPLNAGLGEAFSLSPITGTRSSRRGRNTLENEDDCSSSDADDRLEKMGGVIANKGRIRRCAKDFWHMVGWALNCSVKYPKRWKYWKVWLDFMLDVLDADWVERDRQDMLAPVSKRADREQQPLLRKCLLVKYLSEAKGRSSAVKRVIRSAFADGSPDSLKEFPEVFPNETKELKVPSGRKRKRDNSVKHHVADYDEEDAGIAMDSSELTDQTPEPSQDAEGVSTIDPWLGGSESIALRQRLLMLFSRVAAFLPDCIADCVEVYAVMYECLRDLPVPAFSLLLSPSSSSQLPIFVFVSLTQFLLLRFLPGNAPLPDSIVDRENDDLSQEVLEKCFLPFAASTSSAADNAKVSILVEVQFRQFLKSCKCYHTASLDAAVKKGILARENKSKGDRRRKDSGMRARDEESDREWLRASGERLRGLLLWVEQNDEGD
ncbi:hypothetical protein N431DRAFT_477409 [Stipitochalara longipes BDJ]|nr:hypothetical protein N431DRAFT_477409 [Stipitochalara longipes BDJ]